MNKKEAADHLGVSTRWVEKYASEGRLGEVIYVRGRTGKQAEYDQASVEKLKAELDTPDTSIMQHRTPDARLFVGQIVEALERREQANVEALRGLLERQPEHPRSASIRVSEKILLTVSDCRLLTGLSDATLRDAIRSGDLKARILGKGYKIKRSDLDDFIEKL